MACQRIDKKKCYDNNCRVMYGRFDLRAHCKRQWSFRRVSPMAFVTYSNEAKKSLLGVKEETLDTVGAVSEETARQMAVGAAKAAKADVALSATGIAGPDGGTDEKPVGLVYLGCYCMGNTYVERHVFKGDRNEVRNAAVEAALTLAKKALKE